MRDLTAQVTSSLLRFPEVTIDALGEDEVTLDSVLHGKFTVGRSGLAWLACGPQLEVVHAVTGERFSAYRFSGVTEHPPNVLAVRDFSWLKRSGLLVGLEEDEGSMLCLYDLGISRVVKAVVMPGRITAVEPLVSYGGASASTQHLHQSLRWFFGVVAVVTDIGHVLLVDLCLDDPSCTQSELEASDLEVVNKSPSEIPRLREGVTQQGRHLCLQLCSPTGTGATALQYIHRTNQLAVGFTDGYLQLWNMKTLKKEYHSQLEGGRVPVFAFTFQEPENDPRNCCYLWAVQSAQDHEGDVVSLHLLQLAFGERKCLTSGKILYEGLEYCEERYSQDLSGTAFPLRAQATNTRLLSCQTIEKFRHHPDRDDSMSEVASPDTSVSIFTWQVKSYGQGQPSTFVGVFDINRWYHAQMPDSLRAGESLRNCPYLAVWSLDSVVEMTAPCPLLDVVVHERSLSRGLPYICPPPEQFFNPTTYNFDASCLLNTGIVHLTCSGYQKETLSFLKKAVPSLSDGISNGYSRCLMSGLLPPRLADVQPSSLSQEEQLDAILMTAVETSSLGLITGCIKQWTAEEQPGSAEKLRYILEWAWDKVVHTKKELDGICAPLYDSSSNFTDPQTMKLLQHSQRLLSNLSTIFHCLLNEAQELTQRGLIGLMNKSMVSSLISQYAQVVLWFCRTGLLPESSDDDVLQISRPFYSFSVIKNYYTGQREELQRLAKDKWCADCLMIDGLVTQCGERLTDLWKRDEGGTGQYPPPSLHALLDLYLLENVEESAKHAIVIYLLLDVMYSFPNKSGSSVESFPTAFAIPIGLVKLVQGLWLLDHHDHENSLELLLHPATSHSVWAWQHGRVLQALMCQGKHSIALRYLHVMKPSMSSTSQAKLCLSVLLHNRCIVEAWALLRQHANKLNLEELLLFLYETCQELDLMKELLKLPLGPLEQECLERFLQGTGGFQNRELLMVHYLQQANYVPALQINQALKVNLAADRDPKMKERSNTRNSILNQYGKVLPRAQRKLAIERAKPYQHPATILKEVSRPQPLSTVAKRSATETVLTRAAFIKNVLTKIEEVWVGKDATPEPSPQKSPREPEILVQSPNPPTLHVPEAFVGTPINMLSKRMSRLFDLVVQPSSQTSPEASHTLGTPPRPITSWAGPKSITKAPELSLLQTPQVVKRARALAAAAPVFSSFTPQSILRSSLRPTPVGTPSASPGRSVTPPLRSKESRITFIEEAASPELPKSSVHWSNGLSADREIGRLKKPSLPPKGGVEAWSEHSGEEEDEKETSYEEAKKKPAEQKVESESYSPVKELQSQEPKHVLPTLLRRPSLGHETSEVSIQSDTTLEFHDAPSPGDLDRRKLERHTEVVENSVDEEVVVRLPGTAESAQTSPDGGATEELPNVSLVPAEEHELKDDQEMISQEGHAEDEAQELASDDQIQLDEGEKKSEDVDGHAQEPEVLNHLEVFEEPNQHEAVPEEPAMTKDAEPQPQEPVAEPSVLAEEPISEPPEVLLIIDSEPTSQQPIPEASAMDMELITESLELGEPLIMPEKPVTEPFAEDLVNHEAAEEPEVAEEVEHEAEAMETSDLDEYVERHLFGGDLSPPLTRSGIKESSETWTSFNSEPDNDVKEEAVEAVEAVEAPATDAQKSVASSETATSESRSVVSLNDSEEMSSVESEEESGAEEEEEEEQEEDSGSEVEIIEEVKGNGRQHPTAPALYLEELPPHDQFLQEQATAVLSLVGSDAQLKMIDGVMEGEDEEVVMVGLEPTDLDEEAEGPVCYTELKPSTTLLVPLELAVEHQELLDGGALQALADDEPEEELPAGSSTFSLMLDAGDDEEEPAASEVDPNNHLLLLQNDELTEDMESQPSANPDVLCIEYTPQASVDHSEEMEDLPSAEGEPVVLTAADVEEQPVEPQALPDVAEVKTLQTAEPAFAGEEAHSHLNEGRENGDAENSASPGIETEPEEVPCERTMEEPPSGPSVTNIEGLQVAEDHESDSGKLDEGASPKDAFKPTKEHPKPPSGDEENKEESGESVKEVPKSPARRNRKTVTFPLPVTESENDLSEDSKVPSTPRRVTRSGKQLPDSQVPVTPRRSARKVEPELTSDLEMPSTKAPKPSSPSRTPQKATPRKGSRRTRNTNVGSDEEDQPAEELVNNDAAVPQVRQSARKTRQASVDVPEPDPEVPEEKVPEQPSKAPASPSRVTRKSTRGLSLALESFQTDSAEDAVAPNRSVVTPPRSRRKSKAVTAEKANNVTLVVDEAQLQSVSRRLTRSRLWSHEEEPEKGGEEEERLVLDAPLDVESVNPLANALMERLKDDEARDEGGATAVTEIVRARRRTTRSAVPPTVTENLNEDVADSVEAVSNEVQEPIKKPNASVRRTRASKVSKPDSSPAGESVAFTSVLQRTRGKKKDSAKTEISVSDLLLSPPVTRTRRAAAADEHLEDKTQSNDAEVQAQEVKPRKRTTRTKVAPEPVPPIEVDLMSPLASPADPPARTRKRTEEKDEAVPKMNLRRKRVMEAIFPKPVTRRKKL
ncbi:protein ELYS isoform X2 [Salminus brasiliensis]|uniref:protein ELYS isoform X2 n=1 Tax=Salminus brasiliensis TaxID=930266 RepID=UPI003B834B0C